MKVPDFMKKYLLVADEDVTRLSAYNHVSQRSSKINSEKHLLYRD